MLFGTAKSNERDGAGEPRASETWTEWLDRNQHETWQMELLLTGFVILLLSQARAPLYDWLADLEVHAGGVRLLEFFTAALSLLLRSAWLVTISSLILGVAMRALWISAIGLRSISGDIDLDELGYQPVYRAFLNRRLPAYDDYILRLEQLCSSIFGLTFLTVFAALGLAVAVFVGQSIAYAVLGAVSGTFADVNEIVLILAVVAIIGLLIFFVALDFFSGGGLKQIGGIARVYYPFYRLVGWLTAARLYRPLYYNFIDHKIGRLGVAAIIPYTLILLTVANFNGSSFSEYLPEPGNYRFAQHSMYVDQATPGGQSPQRPSIQSQVVRDGFVKLFIPLGAEFSGASESCDTSARQYQRMLYVPPLDSAKLARYADYLTCVADYYVVRLDGREVELRHAILGQHPVTNSPQLIAMIPLQGVSAGAHFLDIDARKRHRTKLWSAIPFFTP